MVKSNDELKKSMEWIAIVRRHPQNPRSPNLRFAWAVGRVDVIRMFTTLGGLLGRALRLHPRRTTQGNAQMHQRIVTTTAAPPRRLEPRRPMGMPRNLVDSPIEQERRVQRLRVGSNLASTAPIPPPTRLRKVLGRARDVGEEVGRRYHRNLRPQMARTKRWMSV